MFSPMDTVLHNLSSQPPGKLSCYNIFHQETPLLNRSSEPYVEILEEPVSVGARFRYKCEGRSAGCIRGIHSTEKQKTFPTIKVHGYQGAASVVVSCITKDGPPYYPHPHNLVGKTCTNGVCYKLINTPDMICSFSNLGIQCVKKKDIKESLSQREAIQVDPYGSGFTHYLEPNKINLNALRLCFQVFLPDNNNKLCIPLKPVKSNPIFDNKTISDLNIWKLSHCSSPVSGGQEAILLCNKVNKDDIQILFYEENGGKITWCASGKFGPHQVHRKAAISFQVPSYKTQDIQQPTECFVQLRRPSDNAVGKSIKFTYIPLTVDPDGLSRKRNKYEALCLDHFLHPDCLPSNSVAIPRVIKQAVRTKCSQIDNSYERIIVPETDFSMPSPLLTENMNYLGDISVHSHNLPSYNQLVNPSKCSGQTASTVKRADNLMEVAKESCIGLNNSKCFGETTSDETLEDLSSLHLGLDPSDLDVNLSGITLDSFSES